MLAQRPNYMTTQQRIMPYLPKWMKKKVIDVRELFDCCNTCFGNALLWNHALTLRLGKTGNKYYVAPVWNCIDIYMGECRYYGRELCVKFGLEESLHHVKDLNRVRPMIDNIIKKTAGEDFAFGVKKRNAEVQTCDRVAANNSYAKAV